MPFDCLRVHFIAGVCFLCMLPSAAMGQQDSTKDIVSNRIREVVLDSNLRTIQLFPTGLFTGSPVLQLETDGTLTLSFDDLSAGVKQYSYTFIHCNKNWEPDGLTAYDYIDGFEKNQIDDYTLSFGTQQRYTHYRVDFPNDDVRFLLSGNYMVQVWREEDTVPVITRRFIVWEQAANISAQVNRPNLMQYRNEYQEVDFTVDISGVDVTSVFSEISANILQNGRYDNALYNVQPRMVTNSMLTYDNDNQVFPGAKEYRRFSTETLKFQSDRIIKIENRGGFYYAWVNAEESRVYERYVTDNDANGDYVIMANLTNNVEIEADYAWVYFTLKYPYVVTSGPVFVSGHGMPNGGVRMEYDYDKMQYTAKAYLKQGYYNYLYGVRNPLSGIMEYGVTEGNSYQTENEYSIIVYQHVFDRDYDRVIGYAVANSVK